MRENKNIWQYSPTHHTGKYLHRRHTSYALLFFIILLLQVFLFGISAAVKGADVDVFATVDGPLPPAPAVITTPTDGEEFTAIPIDVAGTCPDGHLVKIFSNGAFVGSTACQGDDSFSLQVNLFEGENVLDARIFNFADEEGPASPDVTVTFTPPSEPEPEPEPPAEEPAEEPPATPAPQIPQLFIDTDTAYLAAEPGDTIFWPLSLVGGTGPYAVNIDWGDGTNSVISRTQAGNFRASHIYEEPSPDGFYRVVITASDSDDRQAYLQLFAIVNEPGGGAGAIEGADASQVANILRQISQAQLVFVVLALMIVSFWIGEWREKEFIDQTPRQAG